MSETVFKRANKTRDYTVINNTFIRDTGLSWKAKGVMTYLLSLPDNWEIRLSEVKNHATDGKDSLYSAVKELKEKGYLVYIKERNEKGGFTGKVIYERHEIPIPQDQRNKKKDKDRNTEIPKSVNTENREIRNTENQPLLNTKFKQNTEFKINTNDVANSEELPCREEQPQETTIKIPVSQEAVDLAQYLYSSLLEDDPKLKKTSRQLDTWARDIDKLHRLDGRDWEEITDVMEWARSDTFWKPNIQSGSKFREKFTTLLGQMKRDSTTATNRGGRKRMKNDEYNGEDWTKWCIQV